MFKYMCILTRCLPPQVWKQVLAGLAACLCSVNIGCAYALTGVLLPQLKEDKTILYDEEYDSWIASAGPLSMAAGCLISSSVIDRIGRRPSFMIMIWPIFIGWWIHAYAYNVTLILTDRILTGFSGGLLSSATSVFLGETIEPKYRSMFLLSACMISNIGMLCGHIICGFIGWKISSMIFSIPLLTSFLIFIFLKESPLWLLTNGRLTEGIESFEWYRGKTESSNKELQSILENQNMKKSLKFKEIAHIVSSKVFLKPFITSVIIFSSVQLSGVNAFVFYAQDFVLKTFSGSVDSFWFMILTDIIRTITSIIISAINNRVSTRKSFLFCSFSTFLVSAGLVMYLIMKPTGSLWILATCMILYIGFGSVLVSISWSFIGEIFPNSVRGLGSGISSTITFLVLFGVVKVSPSIVSKYSIAGMYTCNAVAALVGSIILYLLLPVTSNKTLQEIENEYNTSTDAIHEAQVTRI